ncbi:single-stranded DNA-binding protein WHY1, chloroplastic-like isoform X2 [Lotus japonicus]|uniref:single-stranded DNA-binding protein WHY1, chloroplastic-like isoform X2 n=1 Tax=Lotus japonicus TaxID=34305 RepID=UPI00258A7CCE|nr:single-stranded DNA-binding protein WHY1, chloroplastic-like isoform X2 [Lotus japonicus]
MVHSIAIKPCPIPTHSFITTKSITFRGFSPSSSATPTTSLTLPSLSVKCRQTELFDSPQRPPPPPDLPPRVYVDHSLYKGKAVLTLSPKPPEFSMLDSGAVKVSREGYILFQFAPAVGGGTRLYDWNRKQVFSLSVNEMGALISLGARGSCEFVRDPFKGKSDEGKIRKVLKVEPLLDGSGHLFNLSVQNKLKNVDESIFVPVTKAELAVFNSLFNFILPYLLGWNAFGNSIKPGVYSRVHNASQDTEQNMNGTVGDNL